MRTLRLLLILCILPFLSVEAQNSNYYVTPTGAGDGSGWTKPLNAKSFVSKFSDETYQTDTFHLSEGKYLLNAKEPQPLMTNVKGGYVADDYTVRDPFNNESVISGSVSTKENECVTVQVTAPTEAEITLDGVVLESAAAEPVIVSSAGEGSAVILKGCVLRKAAPNVCPNEPVVSHVYDTIYYGATSPIASNEKFDTKRIGCFEETEELTGADGCDSISYHHVVILPTSLPGNFNVFYVKMEGSGEANGSSWADAMSAKDFAFALDKVNDGAIFNMAAGDYSPEYEDCNGKHNIYRCGKVISVKGGYSENPEDGEIPNISRNLTRFILKEDNSSSVLFDLSPNLVASSTFSGIRFVSKKSSGEEAANDTLLYFHSDVYGEKIWFDSCSFSGAALSLVVDSCEFYATDTDFGDGDLLFNGMYNKSNAIVRRCSGKSIELSGNSIAVLNSTFENASLVRTDTVNIAFNTFLSMSCGEETNYTSLSCNIIAERRNAAGLLHSVFNLIALDEVQSSASSAEVSNDIIVDKDMLASVLDDKMVNNRGAFTRTFALKSDVLPNGKSLRVNHLPSDLNGVDQCGTSRLDSTCLGAFEYECVVVPLEDTICWVGKVDYVYTGAEGNIIHQFSVDLQDVKLEMADGTKKSLGVRDVYEKRDTVRHENWTSPDTVFVKRFIALPKADTINTALHYYVKQDSAGTGDGSSWANAMSDTSFAFAFGKVPSGATFHVAEGEYHPVYDKNGKYDFSTNQALMDRVFHTEKLVSVIGGYSNNAEEFPVADTSYHTIFSASITESISANGVMRIEPQQSGEVHISGVRFIDTLTSIYKCKDLLTIDPKSNGVTFRLDSCRFTGDAIRLLNVDSCGGKISMCDFVSLGDGKEKSKVDISGLSSDSLIVNNTSLSCQINVGYYPYYIANSTIDKIVFETNSESNVTKGSIENSTILDLTYYPNTEGILQGNIIYSYVKVKAPITLSNNIVVVNDDDVVEDQDNMYVTREEVNSLWGGESPTMTYPDNSFTQTVKLLKDTLPNGKPIRINRTLSLDQIGQTRLDVTCPGAYEIGFFQRIIELSDTAMALDSCKFSYVLNSSKSALKSWTKSKDGSAYDFAFDLHDAKIPVAGGTEERFVKPGDLYVWRDTIRHDESDVMYDTIFMRKISVLPKPSPNFKESNELHYYVKVDGSGNGDGSSWENAMSNESFDFAIDTVSNGATFHIAAGEYNATGLNVKPSNGMVEYLTHKCINLVGGYEAVPAEGAEPEPGKETTMALFTSDKYQQFRFDPEYDGTISLYGINFWVKSVAAKQAIGYALDIRNTTDHKVSVNIEKCQFDSALFGVYLGGVDAKISESVFKGNYHVDFASAIALEGTAVRLEVNSSLFQGNSRVILGSGDMNFTNNTFIDNYYSTSVNGLSLSGNIELFNNTIFDNVSVSNSSNLKMYGNLVLGDLSIGEECTIEGAHNLINRTWSTDTPWSPYDNIFTNTQSSEVMSQILSYVDGKPNLADNGGFTKTVAMISDTCFWDGQELRVPQELTNVSFDQRGEKRFQMACIGAYEMSEYIHREPLADTTIVVGNPVTVGGASYNKIGEYVWKDTIVNPDGSQTAYSRNVVVMPKAGENLYYYVKQNGDGTGDGSSWSNAMSDSAFAFAFSRVEDGATFHIAEGTYHPIYDENGVDNNHVSDLLTRKEFYTEKLVNIVGGYPATASDDVSVTHDVAQYPTIFDGRVVIEGTQCFGQDVIHISPTQKGKVKISDVIVAGNSCYHPDSTCGALHLTSTEKDVRFVLEKVRFEENKDYALVIDSCKTQISMCDVVGGLVIVRGDEEDSLTVSSSSFSNPVTISTGTYQLTNNTFVGVAEFGKGVLSNKGLLTHNTIKNADFKVGSDCKLKNNIINSLSIQGNPTVTKLSCLNNVMSTSVEDYDATQNIIVSSDEIAAILDSEAKYADGSFTRTIALLKDSVAGQSIRSARLADVKNDQNGRARYDETCAGAFELPGMVITTQGEDTTIIVHESIDGIAFDQIGVHQHCTTTVKEDESKVVTCRTVTVLPKDDASLHYYVSQHGLGLKDGSSQANAMSDSSFAFSFGKVPSRSTFIIVEGGTYYPYNMDDTLAGGLSPKGFYSDRCVSVKALDGLDDNSLPILSGCLGTEKLDTLVYVKNQASADITEFNRIQFSNSSTANGTINDSKMIFEGSVFQLMSCRFKNFTDSLTIQAIRSRGVLEACDFDMNGKFVTFEGPIMEPTPSIAIKRSSFDCIVYANCFNCSVENSSFYSLETKMIGSKVRLTHNTLRKLIITAGNLEVSANLIEDITEKPEFKECNDVMASHENLFGTVGFLTIDIDPSDTVSTGLFGQLTKLDAMAYQGNFTKSYMMIRDTLSDGSSIRVNRESSMSKDQYGKNRYPMTCRGAIELDGYTQHRTLYDTILVHDTYYLDNVRYDEVGYKVINAKALNSYGGEDPITAYLTVLPKNGTGKISAPYHYYVKQNGSGNKDGSSWQNAMSDTTFAEIFGRVRNNSTFHVAAGVYHPVYDQSLALASASDTAIATFYTDRWVNIVGGYDANVTDISAVPNPKGERTIFTRAVAGEDVSAESDSIAVITYAPSVARTFSISGVTISGGTSLQIKAQKSGVMFQVENTLMKYGVGVKADKLDSLYLNAVTFDSCQTGVAAGELSYLKAVNSTFAADPNALDGELAISLPSTFNGRCVLTHNTLLAPVSVSGGSYYWTGNIFAGGVVACDGSKQGKVDSKYNLYPEIASVAQSYDIQNSLTAMEELFGGTWDLDYTLGFTPVLPLASDVLNNGRSIRFKREVSNLSVDQIGESRLFLTCMGAYEYANVTELTIPTAFTPYTKDGINDIFMFGYPVFIYDRYGRLIANSDNGWDGKYRGEDADAGVYVYVLWDANGKQYKGTVEILKQK